MAACRGGSPLRQCSLAKVTSITELDTDTPMHMIVPMNDSRFSVVLVTSSMITTPASTHGTALTEINASRGDSK